MNDRVWAGKHIAVDMRDGKEVVRHGPAVAIVAVDLERRLWLVRQERAGANGPLLELPAGNVDEGEQPLAAARRELREETGLHDGKWVETASFYTSPGFCDERMHLFVARDLEAGPASPEGTEQIELVRVGLDEVADLVAEIEDAKTLVGLLLLLRLDAA